MTQKNTGESQHNTNAKVHLSKQHTWHQYGPGNNTNSATRLSEIDRECHQYSLSCRLRGPSG